MSHNIFNFIHHEMVAHKKEEKTTQMSNV